MNPWSIRTVFLLLKIRKVWFDVNVVQPQQCQLYWPDSVQLTICKHFHNHYKFCHKIVKVKLDESPTVNSQPYGTYYNAPISYMIHVEFYLTELCRKHHICTGFGIHQIKILKWRQCADCQQTHSMCAIRSTFNIFLFNLGVIWIGKPAQISRRMHPFISNSYRMGKSFLSSSTILICIHMKSMTLWIHHWMLHRKKKL